LSDGMIFVSKYGAYKVFAIKQKYNPVTGAILDPGFTVEFVPDVIDAHMDVLREQERRGLLKFNGTPRDANTHLPVDPAERCSSFDTSAIPDTDLREKVEQALLAAPDFGKAFWQFDRPRKDAPWPAYDSLVAQGRRTIDMVAEKIAATVTENGYDPAQVIAYEQANANRPLVVAALEQLTTPKVEEPEPALIEA